MVHNVTIQNRDGSAAVSIPKDIMEFAGLVDESGDVLTEGDVFMQYEASTREVRFKLPEPPEGKSPEEIPESEAGGLGLTADQIDRLKAGESVKPEDQSEATAWGQS